MNSPRSVQGDCAKAVMYFITPVISTGISHLPEMQLISLFSTAVHSWFVMCPWSATRAKHIPQPLPTARAEVGAGRQADQRPFFSRCQRMVIVSSPSPAEM